MKTTPYERGRAFEYRVKRHLESLGYFVFRQARSAPPDLIAISRGSILLIECKVDGLMSRDEKAHLKALAIQMGAGALMAYRKGRRLCFKLLSS